LKTNSNILLRTFSRKLALFVLLGASVGAFASLGDGKKSGDGKTPGKSLLSLKKNIPAGSFSLKSGFIYRDFKVTASEKENFISLNTVITYQKGNSTYILPLKKKVLMDKLTFNPDESSRKF
jgi:hypothetical protein